MIIEKLNYIAYFSPTDPVRIAFYSNGPYLILNYSPANYERGLSFRRWRVVNHELSSIHYFPTASEAVDHIKSKGIKEQTITSRVDHQFYEILSYANAAKGTAEKLFGDDISDKATEYAVRMIEAFEKLEGDGKVKPHIQDVLELLDTGVSPEPKGLQLVKEEDDGSES